MNIYKAYTTNLCRHIQHTITVHYIRNILSALS